MRLHEQLLVLVQVKARTVQPWRVDVTSCTLQSAEGRRRSSNNDQSACRARGAGAGRWVRPCLCAHCQACWSTAPGLHTGLGQVREAGNARAQTHDAGPHDGYLVPVSKHWGKSDDWMCACAMPGQASGGHVFQEECVCKGAYSVVYLISCSLLCRLSSALFLCSEMIFGVHPLVDDRCLPCRDGQPVKLPETDDGQGPSIQRRIWVTDNPGNLNSLHQVHTTLLPRAAHPSV